MWSLLTLLVNVRSGTRSLPVRNRTSGFLSRACYTLRGSPETRVVYCDRVLRRDAFRRKLRLIGVLMVMVWTSLATQPLVADSADERVYDIRVKTSDAATALGELADQTESLLLFPYEVARDRRVNHVIGRYSLPMALEKMLENTDIQGVLTDQRVISVSLIETSQTGDENVKRQPRNVFQRLATGMASIVLAATSVGTMAATDEQEIDEEIIVTGIRGSLQQSLDRKRNAENIVDAITAEDIGDFPDQNLAEALQRVSGVGIDRKDGEGAYLTIRGLGPDFVHTTVNGRTLVSNVNAQANQGSRVVGFDQFHSGLVQAVEVYKSPQANHIEGGLGGVVEIQTRRPLDIGERKIAFSAQTSRLELADSGNPMLFGLFSDKLSDNLGIMVSAQWDDREFRTDAIEHTNYQKAPVTYTLPDGSSVTGFIPGTQLRGKLRLADRDRLNVSGAVQWSPSDRVDVNFDLLYADAGYGILDVFSNLRMANGLQNNILSATTITDNGTSIIESWSTSNGNPFPSVEHQQMTTENTTFGANVDFFASDRLTLNFDLSRSETDATEVHPELLTKANADFSFNRNGGGVPTVTTTTDLDDASLYKIIKVKFNQHDMVDEEIQFRADATLELDDSNSFGGLLDGLDTVRFGFRYADRDRHDTADYIVTTAFKNEPMTSLATIPYPVSDFGSGISGTFPRSHAMPNLWAAQELFITRADEVAAGGGWATGPMNISEYRRDDFNEDINYTETITAVYAMVEFSGELGDKPVSGNLGVRYADTDSDVFGFVVDVLGLDLSDPTDPLPIMSDPTIRAVSHSYAEVLPALNIRMELRDDMLLRVATGKVMSRPVFRQINPKQSAAPLNRTISGGNGELDPVVAWQTDLAFEWYFADYSIFAAGLFTKNADGFIDLDATPYVYPETIDPATGQALVMTARVPLNGGDARITGLEMAYQQMFPMLPAPLDGLGLIAKYTYIESSNDFIAQTTGTDYGVPGLSENTMNLTLFYEKGPLSARISLNKRDSFYQSTDWSGAPIFADDYRQLDASLRYAFGDSVVVSLDAINMADENVEYFTRMASAQTKIHKNVVNTGPRMQFGVRVQF